MFLPFGNAFAVTGVDATLAVFGGCPNSLVFGNANDAAVLGVDAKPAAVPGVDAKPAEVLEVDVILNLLLQLCNDNIF